MIRSRLSFVLVTLVAATGCGLTPADDATINSWLVCIECTAGEREALRALARTKQGPTLDRLASALRDGPTSAERRQSEQQLSAGYAKLQTPGISGRDYVDRYQANFVAAYQRRAALALGDAGGPVAQQVLQTALLEAPRYRQDVVRVIRSALASITTAGPPASVRIVSGSGDTALAGTTIRGPVARVVDVNGNPIAGVTVAFTVIAGGGSLITMGPADAHSVVSAAILPFGHGNLRAAPLALLQSVGPSDNETNSSGIASSGSWELGPVAAPNRVEARVGALADTAISVGAGAPDTLTDFRGDGQAAPVGTPTLIDPAVRVMDENGSPVAGVMVTFSVASGGGSNTTGMRRTDEHGIASAGEWTLGPAPGLNLLAAAAVDQNGLIQVNAGGSQIVDTLQANGTGVGGGQRFLLLHDGGVQPGTDANAYVAIPPAVRVEDQGGNLLDGVPIRFRVMEGGGALRGSIQTTDAGVAAVGAWKLGPQGGAQNVLRATSAKIPGAEVLFTVVAQP